MFRKGLKEVPVSKTLYVASQNAVQLCPSTLPPIGLSSEEPRKHPAKEPDVSCNQSNLPDPWPILTDGEKSLVTNIASMGFPTPRVSRGVQRIGPKEGEVRTSNYYRKRHRIILFKLLVTTGWKVRAY